MVGFSFAGLTAHSLYLIYQAKFDLLGGAPLSSWHDWCLLAAWIVVAAFLYILLSHPETPAGLFLLPIVLILVLASYVVRDIAPFSPSEARSIWNLIHGASLLLGTVVVSLGFVTGLMYLVQTYRLKHKIGVSRRLQLPSLEWLQRTSEYAIVVSSMLLGIGLVSGIVLNLIKQGSGTATIQWLDPVVLTSGILFLWLASAAIFQFVYRPARRGRKVAYVVVASFLFLALELTIVLFTEHGSSGEGMESRSAPQVSESAA